MTGMAAIPTAPAPELSFVIPTYKTGCFVNAFCERAARAASALGVAYEIVFVVDGCPEGSAAQARQAASAFTVVVIELERNVGQDAAVREGLRACRGAFAVILDGDLQDPPEAIAALWPHRTSCDAVFADRFGPYASAGQRLSSRFYRRGMQVLGGLPHGAGLFVLVGRRIIDAVAATRRRRISVLAAIAAAGGRFRSIPVARDARSAGRSAYSSGMRWRKAIGSLAQTVGARYFGAAL